jgi:hypothetical protein
MADEQGQAIGIKAARELEFTDRKSRNRFLTPLQRNGLPDLHDLHLRFGPLLFQRSGKVGRGAR